MLSFGRFVGIDWSGSGSYARANTSAEFPIQVAEYNPALRQLTTVTPNLMHPGTVRRWSRTAVVEWLSEMGGDESSGKEAVLVGLDFAFSFPYCDKSAFFPGRAGPGHWREL